MICMMHVQENSDSNKGCPSQGSNPLPLLLTEAEIIELLRIPQVTKSENHRNVIQNLKRIHALPCIHICKKPLYPLEAVKQWLMDKAEKEKQQK